MWLNLRTKAGAIEWRWRGRFGGRIRWWKAFRSKVRLHPRVAGERLRKSRRVPGLTVARVLTTALLAGDQAEEYVRARGMETQGHGTASLKCCP